MTTSVSISHSGNHTVIGRVLNADGTVRGAYVTRNQCPSGTMSFGISKGERLVIEEDHSTDGPRDVEDFHTARAKQMWGAYSAQAGGKTYDGKPLPTWDELGDERQACWIAAAKV